MALKYGGELLKDWSYLLRAMKPVFPPMKPRTFPLSTRFLWLLSLFCCSLTPRADAQEVNVGAPALISAPAAKSAVTWPVLTGGTSLLSPGGLADFRVSGGVGATKITEVDVSSQPFQRATRIEVTKKPERDYSIRLITTTKVPVAKGDVLLASFWMRGVSTKDEGGQALSAFVFEQSNAPYEKSTEPTLEAPLGKNWKHFRLPFAAKADYETGRAAIFFRLGAAEQSFEIAGLTLVNYAKSVAISDFPKPIQTYEGREPNAPWRRAAAARIEKLRKGDLKIEVVDGAGKPVRGAKIEIRMKRHAFGFGSVVNTGRLLRQPKNEQEAADQVKYREMFASLFNMTVDEGSHKWPAWSNKTLRAEVDQTVKWMRERDIKMRGHVMVWPSWNNSPKWLKAEYDKTKAERGDATAKTYLRDAIKKHIFEIGTTYHGQLVAWDVVNETYTNSDLQTILGREALIDWFKWAKEADPVAKLYINENTILPKNGVKRDFYEREIQFLLDGGAPLEGIGMQGHFGALASPDELERTLNRFGKFGLPIQITEFDYGLADTDPQLQADYTRDFHTLAFSNPHVADIVMWGFWEGAHWRPTKALWNRNWTIKPNGQAWKDLIFKTWWTNADGQSNARGAFQTRGFAGDYEVIVSQSGKTQIVKTALPVAGKSVRVVLK